MNIGSLFQSHVPLVDQKAELRDGWGSVGNLIGVDKEANFV